MNPEVPTILVIDDAPANLELMDALLSGHYRVKVASNAERGLRIARERPVPDLILLDVVMPGVDGYELCRQLKAEVLTAAIPVIFLTARSDVADEQRGLELGAVDYIAKPISAPILLARVRNHLTLKAAADFLRDRNVFLEAEVQRRAEEATQRAHEAQLSNEMTMVAYSGLRAPGVPIQTRQGFQLAHATRSSSKPPPIPIGVARLSWAGARTERVRSRGTSLVSAASTQL